MFCKSLNPPDFYFFIFTGNVFAQDTIQRIIPNRFNEGVIKKLMKVGEHHSLETDSYETSMCIEHRASGGPVIREASVIGVNSTGWEVEKGKEAVSNITPILEIMDIEVQDSDGTKITVRKLISEGHIPFVS